MAGGSKSAFRSSVLTGVCFFPVFWHVFPSKKENKEMSGYGLSDFSVLLRFRSGRAASGGTFSDTESRNCCNTHAGSAAIAFTSAIERRQFVTAEK